MFKKFYVILAAVLMASYVVAQEPQDTTASLIPTDSIGIHPWDGHENDTHFIIPTQSHWSIYLAAGFNVFDGDFSSEKKHGVWFPSVSLGGAYHWTNTWSVGAEYKFRNYRVTGSGNTDRDADIMLKGMSHQLVGYIGFDIFNVFRPQNKYKLFALDLILGGGALCKKNSIFYSNERLMSKILTDTPWAYHTADVPSESDSKFKFCGVFVGGVSAEFNINRSFQMGLRGLYNYTTTDEIDGRPYRGQNNDGFLDVEVLLRYKFEPVEKSNVRNLTTAEQAKAWNIGEQYKNPAVGKAKRDKYRKENPDNLPVIVYDTVYNITRDTIYMAPGYVAPAATNDKLLRNYVVFFENDDPVLDKFAISTTAEAAMLLKRETDRKAVLVGSCDNTGAVEYNKWLAVQRATNVSQTLQDMGISSERIYFVGRGIMQDDREEGSFSINRRVEIWIVTDEELAKAKEEYAYFERYKQVKKGSAVRQPGEGKNASSSEELQKAIERMRNGEEEIQEPQPEPKNEPAKPAVQKPTVAAPKAPFAAPKAETSAPTQIELVDTIVVPMNTTLSQLAKEYYGNANLWVKIYEANRDILSSPDQIQEGMSLRIPKLKK